MRNAKKALSILLSAVIVLGAVAAGFTVSAADARLTVGGEEVDLDRDGTYCYGTVKYSAADHSLTFDNFGGDIYADSLGFDLTIKGSVSISAGGDSNCAIRTLNTNIIFDCEEISVDSYCVTAATIDIGGTMTVNSGILTVNNSENKNAVSVSGTMTLNGGSIIADYDSECDVCVGGDLILNGGSISASVGAEIAVFVGEAMTVNGGSITAENSSGSAVFVGEAMTVNSGSISAVSTSENAVSVGDAMAINGGSVYAKTESVSHSAVVVNNTITVGNGSLRAINTSKNYAVSSGEAMEVSGGSVYAKTEGDSYKAINAPEISLSNGEGFILGYEEAAEIQIGIPGNCITGDTVFYGTYPQSRVTDEAVLTALNDNLSGSGWISFGFYSSEGGYGAMQPGDFMKYQDIALDGIKYRAVTFTSYRPSFTQLPEGADNSYQDDNGYETGTVYWFRFDPLKWRVLDPAEGLIICENAIESRPFNEFISFDGEIFDGNVYDGYFYTDSGEYANSFAFSSIRRWLNEDFLNTAFSDEEKDNIVVSENLDNYEYRADIGNYPSTSDRIFLPSNLEMATGAYGFNTVEYNDDDARIKAPSDYALCQGVSVSENAANWLLRTPKYLSNACAFRTASVRTFGDIASLPANNAGAGIVPAMRLSEIISTQGKKDPAITLSCLDETQIEGGELTITVRLPEDATGTVTLAIGDEKGTAVVSGDGTAEIKIAATPGTHEVLVSYSGDDNYNMVSKERTVKIPKYLTGIELEISPEEPVSGEDITVAAVLPDNATGSLTFNLGTELEETAEIKDGKAILALSGLNTGAYTLSAAYKGDDNYTEATAEISFNVKETAGITVSVSPENADYGNDITLTAFLPDDATGSVTFSIDGISNLETTDVLDGRAVYTVTGLNPGDYTATAAYSGDDKYLEESAEISFAVNKATPEVTVTVSPEEPVYGDKATVTVNYPADATVWSEIPQGTGDPHPAGMITIELDGDILTTTDGSEGVLVYELPVASFRSGGHTVKITFNGDDIYNSRDVETAFTAAKKDVTITANNQEYNYNGLTQGEGDTVYEDPGIIAQKVSAVSLAEGDYIASITLDGQASGLGIHEGVIVPSEAVITNAAGKDVSSDYNISYVSGDITINKPALPLKIIYVYEGGSEAASAYRGSIELYKDYSVTSPAITGYTPDKATVAGTMESLDGVTETVTYTAIEYTATFTADGETVDTRTYTVETETLDEPEIPEKEGYEGKWSEYTIAAGNMEITAEYTAIEYTATFVDKNGETVDTRTYTVETETLDEPAVPEKEGYEGKWSDYTLAASNIEIAAQYTLIEYTATFIADGETVAEIPYTVETESIDAPAVPEKEGFTGEWEEYELTPGGITVNAVYTENEPEDLCPLDNEDHGDGFFGRVRTFIHTLIWKAFRFLGLDVFFKVG